MTEDPIGKQTLDVISEADRFNRWMFETIQPFTNGKILEIGSGIGNISKFFLKHKANMTLSDFRSEYCELLEKKYATYENLEKVIQIDLVHPSFETEYSAILGSYDSVFALNVVEHIEDDHLAVENCKRLLKPGGRLIILVPSYKNLYNQFDVKLGHFRRYTKKTLSSLFQKNTLEIEKAKYFNFIGLFGWYFSGNVLKKDQIPASQMKLYNNLVPVFKLIDKISLNSFGLSTIVVGKKI